MAGAVSDRVPVGVEEDGGGVVLGFVVIVDGFDVVGGLLVVVGRLVVAVEGLVDAVVLLPPQPDTIRTTVSRETIMNSKDLVFMALAPFLQLKLKYSSTGSAIGQKT
ncbi:MAG: hypothetical protein C4542_09165 [Dehalococcoidia bacterium]|nr:MAG: hypothetical protein C4542_09165 [Dehalococcoidia bacterium]